MTVRRPVRLIVIAAAVIAAAISVDVTFQFAAIGTAYAAHVLCSGVFVSGRNPQSVLASDLSADDLKPLRVVETDIDIRARRVTARVFGLAERTASFRDGLGCVVADPREPIRSGIGRNEGGGSGDRWDDVPTNVDRAQIVRALDWAFAEPDLARLRRTRAVVIVHDGRLVAERYAEGFTKDTPLIGWSMAKSVVNALAGILVKRGLLSLDAPVPVDAWREGDPRRAITLSQLLRMSSGLQFDEDSINPRGDILHMLLRAPDAAAYASSRRLEAAPGTRWSYSSGTTNVITGAMRRVLGDVEYATFPRRALFDRIGMHSAVLETDARGNFIGSSFMYATARDWARVGQLYLDDGRWQGERLLPDGWVTYSRTAAPADRQRRYGAHFWLQIPEQYQHLGGPLPDDVFHAIGHEGQFLSIIPSRGVVVVRLGLTRHAGVWDQREFLRRVLEALGAPQETPALAN